MPAIGIIPGTPALSDAWRPRYEKRAPSTISALIALIAPFAFFAFFAFFALIVPLALIAFFVASGPCPR